MVSSCSHKRNSRNNHNNRNQVKISVDRQIKAIMQTVRLRLAVLGLFIHEDEVLMIHQMTDPEPDCWDLPGGGLEPSEPLLEGLRREIKEETSIETFQVIRLLTVAESFFSKSETELLHTVNLIYECSVDPKPLNLFSDDPEVGIKGVQWISVKTLTPNMCSTRSWSALQAAKLIQS